MAERKPTLTRTRSALGQGGAARNEDGAELRPADFASQFGEDLQRALDIGTWSAPDPQTEYVRIEREVREAVTYETEKQRAIRGRLFPLLGDPNTAPRCGGVFAARLDLLPRIQRGLLWNGGVEGCDGTVAVHDTLPLTIYQMGVSLVAYNGAQSTWSQRLFRRDLRQHNPDPVEDVLELLRRRSERGALNHERPQDGLGTLAQRALMSHAERAILLEKSTAVWRLGHGPPVPYELLTGAGIFEVMVAATSLLRQLIERHQKFVFVSSEPRERLLLTVGSALRPLEYAIVGTLRERLETWLHQDRFTVRTDTVAEWDGEPLKPWQWIPRFIEQVASRVVVGVYRASRLAPAQVFYAHEDHADLAAHIVLADSCLQEHRGFPLLLDLAHHVCAGVFGGSLHALTQAAYAAAGAPSQYCSERTTRHS